MGLWAQGLQITDQPIGAPAGARFRLLLLALRHCKQCLADATQRSVAAPFATTMLLEKVLAIALQYFQAPPAWYGRWTKSEARSVATSCCRQPCARASREKLKLWCT